MLFLFQLITHPQYINVTEGNDIALLQLDRPAIFNNFVSPICLPNGEQPAVGEICYATGYGRIGNFFLFILLRLYYSVLLISCQQFQKNLCDYVTK